MKDFVATNKITLLLIFFKQKRGQNYTPFMRFDCRGSFSMLAQKYHSEQQLDWTKIALSDEGFFDGRFDSWPLARMISGTFPFDHLPPISTPRTSCTATTCTTLKDKA